MVELKDYVSDYENKWCPGCGNFGILKAMKDALVRLGLKPSDILLVSGIGQAAKTPHFLKCNMFHGLHGRALPIATGIKVTNHELTVLVNSGDGDCYGEGGNHFLAAIRRNIDVTLLVHNNKVFALTTGQATPTSEVGFAGRSTPLGVKEQPLNPIALALVSGATFVARAYSREPDNLKSILKEAIKHKGFSLVDVMQPCLTFHDFTSYIQDKVYVDYAQYAKHRRTIKVE